MASIITHILFVGDEASAKQVAPIYDTVLKTEAEGNIVETTFFGNMEDSDGCGVYIVLNLIMTIFTFGVGIAAAIGISIAGVTYLTSKGNIEQTNKAKRRIFEIVIGIAFYVVILAAANFLLPEFNTDFKACKTLSDQEVTNRKAQEAAARAQQQQKANSSSSSKTPSSSNKSSSNNANKEIKGADVKGASTIGKKMLQAAEESAQYMSKNKFIYFQYDCSNGYCNPYMKKGYGPYEGESLTWKRAKKVRYSHCSSFATLVEKKAGLLPDSHKYHSYIYRGKMYFKNNDTKSKLMKNFTINHGNGASVKTLVKNKKLAPGDVFGYPGMTHTMVFAGKVNGNYWIYEVNGGNNKVLKYNGGLHKKISGSKKVGDILHAK